MSCNPLPDGVDQVFDYLSKLLDDMEKSRCAGEYNDGNYQAYLHGQLYGAALVLRLLYPGPGNLGEKAALLARPVITEHKCECDD